MLEIVQVNQSTICGEISVKTGFNLHSVRISGCKGEAKCSVKVHVVEPRLLAYYLTRVVTITFGNDA